ncbi:hypothetical protein DIU31_022685 [Mucilaginibacter rubeus]|uniref:Uncharacterized protein n=2 Tax=Mucilaginibacter rubeus TaxID=2027860 RepID=A0A364WTI5_9SPHI|nr:MULTISPECIES: hypothetical protein [Mucilaginibacter]QEM06185.1 hypothetical protein DIU31_022685 [Mucilaginibacter rubeus]QEM13702.1 hypothetical protein DEO27_028040 [Mucilaginibacter rubeus]QEM18767.1 hypothetical protein DIU38_022920 [Mucilaginibacter gossypii]QTE36238.1 hypothetical protein J3L18_24375 [Mucilaginibacter gossypii]QTE44691.1 hypothetical protein J3L19_04800 [Mucilaginibacter rubeus]
MVKIKEGYIMTAREKAEFDRVNALPRKTAGRVDYYYKPQTKYPPRIYVYMHAETWCDRNRRPMGLFYAHPFLSRPMNREEIEYHHFDIRLCYHQYEDWDKLIYAEQQEAEELNKESAGTGSDFLEKLMGYRERYTIGKQENSKRVTRTEIPEKEESTMIRDLIQHGQNYSVTEIGERLRTEQIGKKRLAILILLRELYRNASGESIKLTITASDIERKVFVSQECIRKNFVRRVFQKNPLFAIEEIQTRYPDFNETMLYHDLNRKKAKSKRKKTKPIVDLRRCQLEKLARKLSLEDISEQDYQSTCCRIVLLQNAHTLRLPIPLTVTLNKDTLVYSFNWRTRETVVKSFVDLANTQGMTHEQLGKRYQEITGSNYSF